jgi:repressor LexA
MNGITPRQMDIVVAIRNSRHLYGYPPTFRELSEILGINRASTVNHVKRLVKKGIVRNPGKCRTLEIVADIPQTKETQAA